MFDRKKNEQNELNEQKKDFFWVPYWGNLLYKNKNFIDLVETYKLKVKEFSSIFLLILSKFSPFAFQAHKVSNPVKMSQYWV